MNNPSPDLLLLMLTLAKTRNEQTALELFCQAMEGVWPQLRFSCGPEPAGAFVIHTAAPRNSLGFICIDGPFHKLSNGQQAMIRNAVRLLAVILKSLAHDRLLESEVERRTRELRQEVAERLRAEQALRASEHAYRLVAENTDDVIFTLDNDHNYTFVSPSVERQRGIPPEQALAETLAQSMTPASYQRVLAETRNRAEAERRGEISYVSRLELEQYRGDGSTVWVEAVTKELLDESGRKVGLIGVIRDITERRRTMEALRGAKEEAEQANLAKSEFLANMSHELRTPLNGVMGMLQLLKMTAPSPDQLRYMDTAMTSAKGLLSILSDILNLSQIEAGAVRLERKPFPPRSTLEDVRAIFQLQADEKGLALSTSVDPKTPEVLGGDELRLKQVLFNLTGNAIKFTEKGSVAVEACLLHRKAPNGSKRLYVTVADTGVGIREDIIAHCFEAFTQADGTLSRTYGGVGLGLRIVRRLVDLMGGVLAIESWPGKGTTVHFTVMVDEAGPEPPAVETPGASHPSSLRGARVLVVEDDAVNRLGVKSMLEYLGCVPVCAANGVKALEALERGPLDCVVMDIRMPEMDGVECTRRIRRSNKPYADIPILALTAHAMAGDKEAFLAAGMDDYLSKPVDMDDLARALDKLLAEPQ
ncbi:MAG: response regulator [Desulfovibrionaceae bacterium]